MRITHDNACHVAEVRAHRVQRDPRIPFVSDQKNLSPLSSAGQTLTPDGEVGNMILLLSPVGVRGASHIVIVAIPPLCVAKI